MKIIRKRTLGVARDTLKLGDVYDMDGEVFMKSKKDGGCEILEVSLVTGMVRSPCGSVRDGVRVYPLDVTLVEQGAEPQSGGVEFLQDVLLRIQAAVDDNRLDSSTTVMTVADILSGLFVSKERA
jgi:hypothetical protein